MIFLEIEEIENISVPWLQINSKTSLAFAATLIDITRCHVEVSQHRDNTIGSPTCAFDVGTFRTNIVNAKADTSSRLRNLCTLFQCIVNTINAIILHREEEARG